MEVLFMESSFISDFSPNILPGTLKILDLGDITLPDNFNIAKQLPNLEALQTEWYHESIFDLKK